MLNEPTVSTPLENANVLSQARVDWSGSWGWGWGVVVWNGIKTSCFGHTSEMGGAGKVTIKRNSYQSIVVPRYKDAN